MDDYLCAHLLPFESDSIGQDSSKCEAVAKEEKNVRKDLELYYLSTPQNSYYLLESIYLAARSKYAINMILLCITSLAIAFLTDSAASQESGWAAGQVNATMCQWPNPRAAVVRESLYIDGGYLWWLPGFDAVLDGGYLPEPTEDGNPFGIVYSLNFSSPFKASSNISQILRRYEKGANNLLGPQYADGVMFANDQDWLTYGGLMTSLTDSDSSPPTSQDILGYQVYSDTITKRFTPAFYEEFLPAEVTSYVTYGGGVSIPAQNQGFYFGGFRATDYGPIYDAVFNETLDAEVASNTLISVDMTKQKSEKWANATIPSNIPGRASPELVWIPVASSGALIAIGGVIYPQYAYPNGSDSAIQAIRSNITSSDFMRRVAVYDIENAAWYLQDTSGDIPPATAEGCTVVASASDGSSHNIYWYGGFNGIDATSDFFDDVYVLSVPSFTWIKVYSGDANYGRAGHRCAKPYPDQMFVFGGYPNSPGTVKKCLAGGIVRVFNLSSVTFQDSYDPTVWSEYAVPSRVVNVIGGNGDGNANNKSPTTWANQALSTLFGTPYSDPQSIKTWYPYPLDFTNSTSTAAPPAVTPSSHNGGGLPSWVAPVLGVVLGLMALTAAVVIFLVWRRRHYLRNRQSEAGTSDLNRYRIMSWVRGMPTDTTTKAATVTTEDTPDSNFSDKDYHEPPPIIAHEAADTQVHEMMDTSQPQELHDTGLTYTRLSVSPSGASRATHASRRFPRSPVTPRPESPPLGTMLPSRTRSGVSSTSSRHRHQVSEVGSIDSSSTGRTAAHRTPDMTQHETFFLPVSPPTPANGQKAMDYVGGEGAGGASVPVRQGVTERKKEKENRKSNFEENLDD